MIPVHTHAINNHKGEVDVTLSNPRYSKCLLYIVSLLQPMLKWFVKFPLHRHAKNKKYKNKNVQVFLIITHAWSGVYNVFLWNTHLFAKNGLYRMFLLHTHVNAGGVGVSFTHPRW